MVAAFSDAHDLNLVKVYLHYNGWWAVDFTAAGIHKGAAARILADRMGVGAGTSLSPPATASTIYPCWKSPATE